MGRMINIPIRAVSTPTSNSDWDVFMVATGSSFRGALHMLSLTSNVSAEDMVDLALMRRSGAGSAGNSIIEIAADEGNSRTPDFTATSMVTTVGAAASPPEVLLAWRWTQRGELLYIPTPECREVIAESSYFALNCVTSLGSPGPEWSGFLKIEEF